MLEYPNWLLWECEIPSEVCDEWVQKCQNLPIEKATTFSGHGDDTRKTQIRWVPISGEYQEMHDKLWEFVMTANEKFKLNIDNLPPLQFTEYKGKGHHYSNHHDINWNREDGKHRKISIVVQITDPSAYEGGKFQFTSTENPQEEAIMKKGTVLCFLSYLEHSVSPIESGERSSLVGWVEGARWK